MSAFASSGCASPIDSEGEQTGTIKHFTMIEAEQIDRYAYKRAFINK